LADTASPSTPVALERLGQGVRISRRASSVYALTATILILAQGFVVFGEVAVAEVAQIAVFVFLATAYLAWRKEPERDLMLALALLPLVQLLSLALPTRLVPTLQWFVMIGVPTYLLLVMAAYRLHLRPNEIGLRLTRWQPQARVVLFGAALAIPGYIILRPAPLVADPTPLNVATAVVIVAVFGGFLEEGLFRGVIQSVAERAVARNSIAVSSFATGLLYTATLDLRYMVFAVLVGIAFGTVVRRTGSLVGVAGGHAALLAGQLVLLPALFG
jgi:membrane protease YdiL (CAAX protease family)